MTPQTFRNDDPQAIFVLTYADGEQDAVVGVKVEDDVIVVEYPYGHGSGLKVGRIESETETTISFTVADPQIPQLDGVVSLQNTGQRWV